MSLSRIFSTGKRVEKQCNECTITINFLPWSKQQELLDKVTRKGDSVKGSESSSKTTKTTGRSGVPL